MLSHWKWRTSRWRMCEPVYMPVDTAAKRRWGAAPRSMTSNTPSSSFAIGASCMPAPKKRPLQIPTMRVEISSSRRSPRSVVTQRTRPTRLRTRPRSEASE